MVKRIGSFLLFLLLVSSFSIQVMGEDLASFMLHLKEDLREEYQLWLEGRIIFETAKRYRRSVSDVMDLYVETFPQETLVDRTKRLEELGFELIEGEWYFQGEKIVESGRLFSSTEVKRAYRNIFFGDSKAKVQEKLRTDLGYSDGSMTPEISLAGESFLMSFAFYQDALYQVLIQHKETRFQDDTFRFWDGVKFQDILYQVIYSQYGEPSWKRDLTLASMKPPYDGRVAWSSIWETSKTGGEKVIRIGINFVSFKGTLLIEYLPIALKKGEAPLTKDMENEEDPFQDAGRDF